MKKTYWCAMSEYYLDGTVKAAMISRACKEKPKNSHRRIPIMNAYHDWFDTEAEAHAAVLAVLALNKKQGVAA
jgi:hypothetical protein